MTLSVAMGTCQTAGRRRGLTQRTDSQREEGSIEVVTTQIDSVKRSGQVELENGAKSVGAAK